MANQTLSSYNSPNINGIDAGVIIANTVMSNIYQAEIEKGGRGVTQEYTNDTTCAQIRVIRPLPLKIEARELGAAINGGNFSAFTEQVGTDAYGINIITVIDDNVDIADVNLDMIPVDILSKYVENISDKVVLNMNAIKIAARAYTCFSQEQVDATKAYVVEFTAGTDKVLDKIIETNGKLNKGDKEHGVSAFPMKDRIGLVNSDQYASLLTSAGVFNLGGANFVYQMLAKGALSPDAKAPELLDDGYLGDIANVPYHFVSDLVMETACKYLGFPTNTFDSVLAHIASAHGNLFGLAANNSVKTIDNPNGQGIRLQPKYRMGCACIMPKSAAWLVKKGSWVNPYDLKAIFSSGVTWSYKAPGSRNRLVAKLTPHSTTAGHFTPSLAKLVRQADGTDAEVAMTSGFSAAWVEVTTEIDSIEGFLKAYNADSANNGTLASTDFGADYTFANVAGNEKVCMLVVDSDGTVAICNAKSHA